jgi:hypothetical protein
MLRRLGFTVAQGGQLAFVKSSKKTQRCAAKDGVAIAEIISKATAKNRMVWRSFMGGSFR